MNHKRIICLKIFHNVYLQVIGSPLVLQGGGLGICPRSWYADSVSPSREEGGLGRSSSSSFATISVELDLPKLRIESRDSFPSMISDDEFFSLVFESTADRLLSFIVKFDELVARSISVIVEGLFGALNLVKLPVKSTSNFLRISSG